MPTKKYKTYELKDKKPRDIFPVVEAKECEFDPDLVVIKREKEETCLTKRTFEEFYQLKD